MEQVNSFDENWEQIHQERDWGMYPSENLISFIARNFYKSTNRKEIKILEFGFGTGAQIWFLSREGFEVYGIEGSETAVNKANSRMAQEGLKANLMTGDALNIDELYKGIDFDCIIDMQCLTCIPKEYSRKIIEASLKLLKPGGVFYSQTLAKGTFLGEELEEVEPNTYAGSTSGNLIRKRLVRVTDEKEISEIYEGFSQIHYEKKEHLYGEGLNTKTSEWIIHCTK